MSDASLKSKPAEPDDKQPEDWATKHAARKAQHKKSKEELLAAMSGKDKEACEKRLAETVARKKENEKCKAKGQMTKKEKYKARKSELKAAKGLEKAQDGASSTSKRSNADGGPESPAKKQKLNPLAVRCFLTGLPYNATEQHIVSHFREVGPSSVEVLRDRHTGKSNGTAFATFDTAEQASEAVSYTGSEIQKRWIRVRLCEVRESDKLRANVGPGEKPADCQSIVLTGLLPTVEDDDLWTFYEDCDVQSVSRMMDTATGIFRGMAFVDFTSTDGVDMAIKKKGKALKGSSSFHIRYKVEKVENAHDSRAGKIASHNRAAKVPDWKGTRKALDSDSDDE